MNCIHGIDSRFCATCNKPTPRGAGVSLEEVLQFLNEQQVRATYGAVAKVLGVMPRSTGALLGPHRPEASWVVSADHGLPTDYSETEWHRALLSRPEIIKSGRELALRLSAWNAAKRPKPSA